MKLTEKFANLNAEQLQQIREIKDAEGLYAFLGEQNIELDEAERAAVLSYIETGKQPLDDDELDAVAGGQDKDKNYRAMAYADGRNVPLKPTKIVLPSAQHFCSCFIDEAWARTVAEQHAYVLDWPSVNYTYFDCKCYRCGHEESRYVMSVTKTY